MKIRLLLSFVIFQISFQLFGAPPVGISNSSPSEKPLNIDSIKLESKKGCNIQHVNAVKLYSVVGTNHKAAAIALRSLVLCYVFADNFVAKNVEKVWTQFFKNLDLKKEFWGNKDHTLMIVVGMHQSKLTQDEKVLATYRYIESMPKPLLFYDETASITYCSILAYWETSEKKDDCLFKIVSTSLARIRRHKLIKEYRQFLYTMLTELLLNSDRPAIISQNLLPDSILKGLVTPAEWPSLKEFLEAKKLRLTGDFQGAISILNKSLIKPNALTKDFLNYELGTNYLLSNQLPQLDALITTQRIEFASNFQLRSLALNYFVKTQKWNKCFDLLKKEKLYPEDKNLKDSVIKLYSLGICETLASKTPVNPLPYTIALYVQYQRYKAIFSSDNYFKHIYKVPRMINTPKLAKIELDEIHEFKTMVDRQAPELFFFKELSAQAMRLAEAHR